MSQSFLRKIDLMHKLYGEIPDRKCKECRHLCSYTASRKYYKCECYGETRSEATDWRVGWNACSLIDVEVFSEYPVVRNLRYLNRATKEPSEVDWQISLFA